MAHNISVTLPNNKNLRLRRIRQGLLSQKQIQQQKSGHKTLQPKSPKTKIRFYLKHDLIHKLINKSPLIMYQ